jgi:serine protease Do
VLPLMAAVALSPLSAAASASAELWHERPNGSADVLPLPSLSPLVKEVGKAVLTITVEANQSQGQQEPMFRGFGFEFRLPDMGPMKGQGSGFLIHESGYALTNHHVIEHAGKITVNVGGSPEEYDAEVVGTDPTTDVALIKLKGKKRWPFIPLGDSDALEVGDFVVAIGNPFGLSQTVSTGIISAEHRRELAPSGRHGLYDFLQTDASINPGNSGGPLINLKGEVVGINAAVNRAGQGLGFAIPVNLVKQLVPQLEDKGAVSRSWIGVAIQSVAPELAEGFGLDRPRGALVAQVVEDGPAAKAGLLPGDVILSFDGKPIEESSDLPLLAAHAGVGKRVKLGIKRDARDRAITLTLGEMPGTQPAGGVHGSRDKAQEAGKLGIQIDDLDKRARQQLGLSKAVKGALVVDIVPFSPAANGGLKPGDVVTKVNGRKVSSARGFVKLVTRVPSGKLVKLLVRRGKSTMFVAMKKP